MNKIKEYNSRATLLIHCPDRQGIVVSVTDFIYKNSGNITYLEQHVDIENKTFFMRVQWSLNEFTISRDKISENFKSLISEKYNMNYEIYFSDIMPRMAIFVSKIPHCLYDLLSRYKSGTLNVEIPFIISNHKDLKHIADQFGIEFHHIEITKDRKKEGEKRQLELLRKHKINFVVLARYMQIISENFITHYPNRIINIHHSFLPAFPGAKPYHSAYERGVKIIGGTSHYVTADLDAGPIISQDVIHIDHTDSIEDLVRKGQDLEKIILSRAVWSHVERKTLVFKNKTVVFS